MTAKSLNLGIITFGGENYRLIVDATEDVREAQIALTARIFEQMLDAHVALWQTSHAGAPPLDGARFDCSGAHFAGADQSHTEATGAAEQWQSFEECFFEEGSSSHSLSAHTYESTPLPQLTVETDGSETDDEQTESPSHEASSPKSDLAGLIARLWSGASSALGSIAQSVRSSSSTAQAADQASSGPIATLSKLFGSTPPIRNERWERFSSYYTQILDRGATLQAIDEVTAEAEEGDRPALAQVRAICERRIAEQEHQPPETTVREMIVHHMRCKRAQVAKNIRSKATH